MGYWDGKCFFCMFWGKLDLIIGLSVKPNYKDIKKKIQCNNSIWILAL